LALTSRTTMKYYLLLSFLSLSIFASTFVCEEESNNNFVARYEIQTPQGKSAVNYYRLKDRSAFEYTQQGITEVWTKTINNNASMIKGFDKDQRSIEYETIDLTMDKKNSSWNKRSNLMHPKDFNFKNNSVKTINGCVVKHYEKSENGKSISMDWNEKRDILVNFEIKDQKKVYYDYQLKSLKSLDLEDNHIVKVQGYERTDFADIGDNESDPFFRKMINLGFITHHETNIINDKGQLVEAESHHH